MSQYRRPATGRGIIHIQSTRNNTIVTCTDLAGNTRCSRSGGLVGFRNSRKSTGFAAGVAADQVAQRALQMGISWVVLRVRGLGYGKESAVRALLKSRLRIRRIEDRTPTAHNGCRPRKPRRT
jgi:small subunit ribosomal protein S11